MSTWAKELPMIWKGISREKTAYLFNCWTYLPFIQYLINFVLIHF